MPIDNWKTMEDLDVFRAAANEYRPFSYRPSSGISNDTAAICTTILISTDILRRTILTAADSIGRSLSRLQ